MKRIMNDLSKANAILRYDRIDTLVPEALYLCRIGQGLTCRDGGKANGGHDADEDVGDVIHGHQNARNPVPGIPGIGFGVRQR